MFSYIFRNFAFTVKTDRGEKLIFGDYCDLCQAGRKWGYKNITLISVW